MCIRDSLRFLPNTIWQSFCPQERIASIWTLKLLATSMQPCLLYTSKEPGGPYQIGKVLRALFSPPESVFKWVTQNNDMTRKGSEPMIRPILKDCAKYAWGPPKWIRTDSLSWIKTEKVNQIWFTRSNRANLPRVGQILRVAHGRDITRKPAVWRVCGAVGRREPYNLTLESKTYYTQKDDSMR